MTLVEIVVAAVILFIILTGILGLIGQSTRMSAFAKQQNVMTNALGAYVEWLHSLPFEDVAHVDDGGRLDPTDDRHTPSLDEDEGDFEVFITPVVIPDPENEFLKRVEISISVVRADGVTQEMSTTVTIRDRNQHLFSDQGLEPEVEFTLLTPSEMVPVWGNQSAEGSLVLQVTATPAEGRRIDRVIFSAGGYNLEDINGNSLNIQGIEDSEVGEAWTSPSNLVWNSAQTRLNDDGQPELLFPNGPLMVSILVYDNAGAERLITRTFYVDNTPPGDPGPPFVAADPTPPTTTVQWDASSGVVFGYEFDLRRQGAAQVDALSPFADGSEWEAVAYQDAEDPRYALTGEPFSRYIGRVFSKGARYDLGYQEYRSEWVEGDVFTTRPALGHDYTVEKVTSGQQDDRGWFITSRLEVTEPSFPTLGQVVYSFHKVEDGMLVEPALQVGESNVFEHTVEHETRNPDSGNYPLTRYGVSVTYTPDGYQGGTVSTIRSNTVSTTYRSEFGTQQFSKGTYPFAPGDW